MCLAHRVVRERAQRLALLLVELPAHFRRHDQVGVRRQLVTPRVGVGVDAFQLLSEVHRWVALVGVDLRLQQRYRNVLRRWLGVEACSVENLRHWELRAKRVRVVHVANGTFGETLAHVASHTEIARLSDHAADRGVERRVAARWSTTRFLAEVVPEIAVQCNHPFGELSARARTIRPDNGHDRTRRHHQAGVVGLDRRVIPSRDDAREDLGDVLTREAQVGHPLAVDLQVVHERCTTGDDRNVCVASRRRVLRSGAIFGLELERNV